MARLRRALRCRRRSSAGGSAGSARRHVGSGSGSVGGAMAPRRPPPHPGSMRERDVANTPASCSSATSSAGSAGERCSRCCPSLRERYAPDFVVVNGENAAGGIGITPKNADQLFDAGVDVITLGNHTYRHREIYAYLDADDRIIRPANFLRSQPGHGWCVVDARRRPARRRVAVGQPVHERRPAGVHRGRRRAARAQGSGRPRARRHARRGDEREGRHGLVPRRPGNRGRRHPHAHPHR